MSTRDDLIAHAATCREAIAADQPRPAWQGGDLTGADLRDAKLIDADLRDAKLAAADLRGAYLIDADLRGVDLTGADLTGACLSGADLTGACLSGADLTDANLSGVNLRRANLYGATLSRAHLIGAKVAEGAVIASTAGEAGGYLWHALRVEAGVVLQYGCDRATLAEWRARGPEYGARHHHDAAHWATGPAVAIAAAEALLNT